MIIIIIIIRIIITKVMPAYPLFFHSCKQAVAYLCLLLEGLSSSMNVRITLNIHGAQEAPRISSITTTLHAASLLLSDA